MKKVATCILIALCATVMCLGMVACTNTNTLDGNYQTVSVSIDGESYDVGEEIPANKIFDKAYTVRKDDMLVAISTKVKTKGARNGSFYYNRSFGGGLDAAGGRWYEESEEISFSFDGANIDNKELNLTDDGKLIFKLNYSTHIVEFTLTKVK